MGGLAHRGDLLPIVERAGGEVRLLGAAFADIVPQRIQGHPAGGGAASASFRLVVH